MDKVISALCFSSRRIRIKNNTQKYFRAHKVNVIVINQGLWIW